MPENNNLIVCPHCRAINRVHAGREAEAACGKCKAKVFEPFSVELVGATFERHLTKTDIPVLVDFYSPSCGPCLMMTPQFEEAAKQLYPKVRLAKVDTSQEVGIAGHFGIRSVPTLMLFKNGQQIASQPGAMNAGQIVTWANQYV